MRNAEVSGAVVASRWAASVKKSSVAESSVEDGPFIVSAVSLDNKVGCRWLMDGNRCEAIVRLDFYRETKVDARATWFLMNGFGRDQRLPIKGLKTKGISKHQRSLRSA